jgi:hypothetical protein
MGSGSGWMPPFNRYGAGGADTGDGYEDGTHNLTHGEQATVLEWVGHLGPTATAQEISQRSGIAQNRVALFLQGQGQWHDYASRGQEQPGGSSGAQYSYGAEQGWGYHPAEQAIPQHGTAPAYGGEAYYQGDQPLRNYPAQPQNIPPVSTYSTLGNALGSAQTPYPHPALVPAETQPPHAGATAEELPIQVGDLMGEGYQSDPHGAVAIYRGAGTPAGFDEAGMPQGYAFNRERQQILGRPHPDPDNPGQVVRYARNLPLRKNDTEGNQKSRGKFLRAIQEDGMYEQQVSKDLGKNGAYLRLQNRILPTAFKRREVSQQQGGAALHSKKNEFGKSIAGIKAAEMMHAAKNEYGKSIAAVKAGIKAAEKLHSKKDEDGKSIAAKKLNERKHAAKDESGKSIAAVKAGVKAGRESGRMRKIYNMMREVSEQDLPSFQERVRAAKRNGFPETGQGQLELMVNTFIGPDSNLQLVRDVSLQRLGERLNPNGSLDRDRLAEILQRLVSQASDEVEKKYWQGMQATFQALMPPRNR